MNLTLSGSKLSKRTFFRATIFPVSRSRARKTLLYVPCPIYIFSQHWTAFRKKNNLKWEKRSKKSFKNANYNKWLTEVINHVGKHNVSIQQKNRVEGKTKRVQLKYYQFCHVIAAGWIFKLDYSIVSACKIFLSYTSWWLSLSPRFMPYLSIAPSEYSARTLTLDPF